MWRKATLRTWVVEEGASHVIGRDVVREGARFARSNVCEDVVAGIVSVNVQPVSVDVGGMTDVIVENNVESIARLYPNRWPIPSVIEAECPLLQIVRPLIEVSFERQRCAQLVGLREHRRQMCKRRARDLMSTMHTVSKRLRQKAQLMTRRTSVFTPCPKSYESESIGTQASVALTVFHDIHRHSTNSTLVCPIC